MKSKMYSNVNKLNLEDHLGELARGGGGGKKNGERENIFRIRSYH